MKKIALLAGEGKSKLHYVGYAVVPAQAGT
jgi:hypothetical protein